MSRLRTFAWPLALAAGVAFAGIVALSLARGPALATPAEQVAALAAELRCPDCQGLSVADSPTRSATEIRREISAQLADGRSPDEVRTHFVDRYGEWILLSPARPLLLVLPLAALLLGAGLLIWWLRPARPERPLPDGGVPGSPSSNELRRIRDEVEGLDG